MFERKHSINWRESFVSGMAESPLLEREKNFNTLLGRHGLPLANFGLVGFREAREDADHLLHTTHSTSLTCKINTDERAKMLKVGLTGGLASGKSFVGQARQLFRKKLALEVFSNKARLSKLNSLVHPEVHKKTDELMAAYFAADPDAIVVVEAAIHIETGGYKRFDKLILVVCDEQQQIERAMHRGATREEAMARLASQMPLAEKRKFADYVIDTSGAKEDTLRQTREVYNSLRSFKL